MTPTSPYRHPLRRSSLPKSVLALLSAALVMLTSRSSTETFEFQRLMELEKEVSVTTRLGSYVG
jgi:hypothetical protein